jgi:hypothetical protein
MEFIERLYYKFRALLWVKTNYSQLGIGDKHANRFNTILINLVELKGTFK